LLNSSDENIWTLRTPFSFRKSAEKYIQVLKISLNTRTTYIADFLSRAVLVGFIVWVLTQLYSVTYASKGVSEINGVTLPVAIWTLALVHSFYLSPRPAVSTLVGTEVKAGTLAYSINKPYSYILFHYFTVLGKASLNLFMNVLATTLTAFLLVGPIHISLKAILAGTILLFFGLTMDFLFMFSIGLSSFWLEDPKPFTWIYLRMQLIFGGLIIPLSLFPNGLRKVIELLPFSQNFYGAAHMITAFNTHLFFKFLLVQFFWILCMSQLIRFIFKKAMKNISINGG
jgi:ABC-2 type transport system permease protein